MARVGYTYIYIGNNSVLVTATDSASTYYWYRDGVLVEASERSVLQFDVYDGGIQIDIFDSSSDTPDVVNPDRVTLQWYPSDYGSAQKYIVREWDDPDLTDLGTLFDPTNQTVFRFTSGALASGAHELRIYPVNAYGTEGNYREVSFTARKASSPGDASISYDSGTSTLTGDVA